MRSLPEGANDPVLGWAPITLFSGAPKGGRGGTAMAQPVRSLLVCIILAALFGCAPPDESATSDQAPLGLDREQLWNFITTGDVGSDQPTGQLPEKPHYETWALFPGPADNPDEFLNKRLGLPVHGRWVTVYANPVAEQYVREYLATVDAGDGEVPPADLPIGSIIVKVNYGSVQEVDVIAQAPDPAVLTIAYKPSEDFCQGGVLYNGTDCLGGNWMWAFYGLEGVVNGILLKREGQDKPVASNTQAFCINCHDPGSRTDYLRGLQRIATVAAHERGPVSNPAPPPDVHDDDPFCESIALSPDLPVDVALDPASIEAPLRQKMFDCFSWRTFVALNWPALEAQRGEPDRSKSFGDITDGVDTVWETYKATWELFQPQNVKWDPTQRGNPAGEWSSPRLLPPACPTDPDVPVIAHVTKTASRFPDNVNESGQAFAGSFGTLTDRNGNFVRYQVLFNEKQFDFLLPNAATVKLTPSGPDGGAATYVPDGASEVKSSWKVLCMDEGCQPRDHPEDYYSRDVLFFDAEKGTCEPQVVGLTGLHVIVKTFWAPQWIWATFEHESNSPTGPSGENTFSFYDPSCQPTDGFVFTACSTQPFLAPKRLPDGTLVGDPCCPSHELNRFSTIGFGDQPNQVTRLDEIGGSGLNVRFADAISTATSGSSPFSNYVLVNTQWPFHGRRPADPQTGELYVNHRLCPSQQDIGSDPLRPIETFPTDCYTMVPTFLRNTSMETYMQTWVEMDGHAVQVSNRSCMGCHASGNDFSYVWLDAVEQPVCIDDPANGIACAETLVRAGS